MRSNDLRFRLAALDASGVEIDSQPAYPLFAENISIKWTKHEGDQFYLPTVDTEFTFLHEDLTFIQSYTLGTTFALSINSLLEGPTSDTMKLITVHFKQVDGTFIEVEGGGTAFKVVPKAISPYYESILSRLDEEVDLFSLENAPEMTKVKMYCRPILQMYVLHTGFVGNWLGSVYWETPVEDDDFYFASSYPMSSEPDPNNVLDHRLYGFRQMGYLSKATFSFKPLGDMFVDPFGITDTYIGNGPSSQGVWDLTGTFPLNDGFSLVVSHSGNVLQYAIRKEGTTYWLGYDSETSQFPFGVLLTAQPAALGSANISLYVDAIQVASRLIAGSHPVTDSNSMSWGTIPTSNTHPSLGDTYWGNLRQDDPFFSNKNYKYYIQYNAPDSSVLISGEKTEEPNQYGLYQPGIYYKPHAGYQPFAPSSWGAWSIWHTTRWFDRAIDESGSRVAEKDCYSLWSVLYVLLKHINPSIAIRKDRFSIFFDNNPDVPNPGNPVFPNNVIWQTRQLNVFLTPSSNVLSVTYDQPASRAKITLGKVLEMLKKVYKVYWYLDLDTFRCEHISWFEKGGTYVGSGNLVFEDLTSLIQPLLNWPWSYGQGERSTDKGKLYSTILYEWAQNSSDPFNSHPIEMLDDYVDKDLSQDEKIDGFIADVDMLMASPDSFSKDLFVLLDADKSDKGSYYLPEHDVEVPIDQATYTPQNWRLSARILNSVFRSWSLPCQNIGIEGYQTVAWSLAKNSMQKVSWPESNSKMYYGLIYNGPFKILIRTQFGDGLIQDLSVYLLSRKIEANLRVLLPGQVETSRSESLAEQEDLGLISEEFESQ